MADDEGTKPENEQDPTENQQENQDPPENEGEKQQDAQLKRENAERRVENKALKASLDKALADLKAFTDKDKSEIEKATSTAKELEEKVKTYEQKIHDLALQNAFLADKSFKWRNPKAALKLADLSKVEIDEDGTVTGLSDALKALAKSDPYLLEAVDEDNDPGAPPAGQPPKNKPPKGTPEREKLLAKYPALRR